MQSISREFPGGLVVRTVLPLYGVKAQSLIKKLRSLKLCDAAKK